MAAVALADLAPSDGSVNASWDGNTLSVSATMGSCTAGAETTAVWNSMTGTVSGTCTNGTTCTGDGGVTGTWTVNGSLSGSCTPTPCSFSGSLTSGGSSVTSNCIPVGSCLGAGLTTGTWTAGGGVKGTCPHGATCEYHGGAKGTWIGGSGTASGSCVLPVSCTVAGKWTGTWNPGTGTVTGTCSLPGTTCTFQGGMTGTWTSLNTSGGGGCRPNSPSYPSLSINDRSTTEGNGDWHFSTSTISLSAPAGYPVLVRYETADGTAKASDNDYEAKAGWAQFLPGQTAAPVHVVVNGDGRFEADEAFQLKLSDQKPSGVTLARSAGTDTIVNDDAARTAPPTPVGGGSGTGASAGGSVGTGGTGAGVSAGASYGSTSRPASASTVRCVVPRLKGRTFRKAVSMLKKAHCGRARTFWRYSKLRRGLVVKSNPGAGWRGARNYRVSLVRSRGPRPRVSLRTQLRAQVRH